MIRAKICCISSMEEARTAVRAGAAAVGLVSEMPSGPGVITEAEIARIAATVPWPVATVLLTSKTSAQEILAQQQRCRPSALQICDTVAPEVRWQLRKALPGVGLIQVVHVRDAGALDEAQEAAATCDAILLDSGNQSLGTPELGGTGRTHDWAISARIVREVAVPVILAGGLKAENVAAAVEKVQPWMVDVCSGVRSEDRLDARKLGAFLAVLRP